MTSSRHCRTVVDRTILPLFLASRLAQPLRVCAARFFVPLTLHFWASARAAHSAVRAGGRGHHFLINVVVLTSHSHRAHITIHCTHIALASLSHQLTSKLRRTRVVLAWHSHRAHIAVRCTHTVNPSFSHRSRSRPIPAGWGQPQPAFFALDTEQAFVV